VTTREAKAQLSEPDLLRISRALPVQTLNDIFKVPGMTFGTSASHEICFKAEGL
jgi:hypothetical protein